METQVTVKRDALNMELPTGIRKFLLLVSLVATADLKNVASLSVSFKRTSDSAVHYGQFVGNAFSKLITSSIATLHVASLGECTFECIKNRECFSVNFGDQTQGEHICELLNEDKFNRSDKFAPSHDFHHYNLKVGAVVLLL